jgi:hypothetical protein
VTVTVVGAGQPEVVEVGGGGGGLHWPLAAVPKPHQWETGVLVVVAAEVVELVLVTVVLVVGGAELHLPFNAVPKPQ